MTRITRGRMAAAALAAVAVALAGGARADGLACEQRVGLVAVDRDGAPRVDAAGAPVLVTPGPLLEVRAYPALVGFTVELRNGGARSEVKAASAAGLDRILKVEGALFETPLRLEARERRTRAVVVALASHEECLRWAGVAGASACPARAADLRVVVSHDRGSAECRARLVCHPPAPRR